MVTCLHCHCSASFTAKRKAYHMRYFQQLSMDFERLAGSAIVPEVIFLAM